MRATGRQALAWLGRLHDAVRVRLLVRRGRRHLEALRWERGVADLRAALELRPEDFSALLWLSRAYLRVGEFSRARHILARLPHSLRGRHEARVLGELAAEVQRQLDAARRAPPGRPSWAGCLVMEPLPPAAPLGDWRDAAERARLQRLPPLPPAGSVDWDEVGRRLQQDAGPPDGSHG